MLFAKFSEREPGTNFFDDITKLNFKTLFFTLNEVKLYLYFTKTYCSTQYFEKPIVVLHESIRSVEHKFEALLQEYEIIFNIIFIYLTNMVSRDQTIKQSESFSLSISFCSLQNT